MPRTRPIPWLIILIGIGFLALSAWSIHLATRGASAVTDDDYYRHGLRFNQTLLEQKAAAALGWEAAVQLQGRVVAVHLYDRNQRAVTGASGTLLIHGNGAEPGTKLDLQETDPGSYQAELPADLRGEHPGEIAFQLDGARLSKRLLLSIN